jgi:hypothetical protein
LRELILIIETGKSCKFEACHPEGNKRSADCVGKQNLL